MSTDSTDAITRVRAVYAAWERRLPPRNCTGRADCCRFKLSGHIPYLTAGEALVAAQAWRTAGRKDLPIPADGTCPFLHPNAGICRIYDGRPFGCRTHFCQPAGGPASRNEVRELIQQLEDIDHSLGGSGSTNLIAAMKSAMAPSPKSRRKS